MILRRLRTTRLFSRNLLEEGVVKNNAKFTPECAVLYIIKIGERLFLKDGDKIKFLFSWYANTFVVARIKIPVYVFLTTHNY